MSRYTTSLCLGLLVFVALFTGCSRNEAAAPVAATADEAVLLVTNGLAEGRPQVAWQALPDSYQRDVTELIHEFAGKMDAELWDRSFGILQKATRVLREKREFILDHPMMAAQIQDRDEAEEAWDALVDILELVANSDLANLERLEKLDVEHFLSESGADLMESFKQLEAFAPNDGPTEKLHGLADTKATLISSEGETARVKIETPGQPTEEKDFVRVEGKWIPAEIATDWDETITLAREELAGFSSEEMQENKATALMQLSMIEGALDQLLATETAAEFQTAVGGVMGMVMGAMMAQAQSSMNEATATPFNIPSAPDAANAASAPTYVPVAANEEPEQNTQPLTGSIESYVGERVRVTERDGSHLDGFLINVSDDMLILEKRVIGGSVTMELSRARLDSVELIR